MNEEALLKANERIDALSAQGIRIIQSPEVFAFSLDAVLLADFVRPNRKSKLQTVDLCAGNGAIGLFLNRKLGGHITEVELQTRLADMAERSVALNQLTERYTVINADVKDIYEYLSKDSADIVVCNPPYFKDLPTSEKNPNPHLALAASQIAIDLAGIVSENEWAVKNEWESLSGAPPERGRNLNDLFTIPLGPKRLLSVSQGGPGCEYGFDRGH